MSKLKDLFYERSSTYASYCDIILREIENNVIPAVLEMLELTQSELDRLEWNNVQLLEEEYLILSGVIGYKEGDVISDDDITVTLDAAMALMLDKIIRVAIPIELAETGSKNDVYAHLYESQQQLREEYETIYGHAPPTMEEAMEEALRTQLGMDLSPDFDYNELSDEQKKSLAITMAGRSTKEKLN
jgi:hypothetical protein